MVPNNTVVTEDAVNTYLKVKPFDEVGRSVLDTVQM